MTDAYRPTPDDRFTFGLWTVGNTGRDPFGHEVRPPLRSGRLGAAPGRPRRVRRELPRRRSRPAGFDGCRARGHRQAVPPGPRRHGHEGADGDDQPLQPPVFKEGAFTANDPAVRRYALAKTLDAIELGCRAGRHRVRDVGRARGVRGRRRQGRPGRARPLRRSGQRVLRPRPGARVRPPVRPRAEAQRAARRHAPPDRRPCPRVHHRARVAGHGRPEPRVRPRDDVGPVVPPRRGPDAVARQALPHRPQRAARSASSTRTSGSAPRASGTRSIS